MKKIQKIYKNPKPQIWKSQKSKKNIFFPTQKSDNFEQSVFQPLLS